MSRFQRQLFDAIKRLRQERDELNWRLSRFGSNNSRIFRMAVIGSGVALGLGGVYHIYKKELEFSAQAFLRSGRTALAVLKISLDYQNVSKKLDRINESLEKDPIQNEVQRAFHIRAAWVLLKLFQRNGGVYIKIGQHLSALEYILPPEFCAVMSVLQNEAPQSSLEDVERVLREELGDSIEGLFEDFDPVPIGTASLAQVHRAKLRETGEAVAVKIQHRAIQSYAEVDMFVVSLTVQAVKYFFPDFEFDWLAEEMKTNLPKELNFIQEAHNSERVLWNFQQNSERYPDVLNVLKIPKINWKHTNSRVLTMEYCPGHKITDLEFMRKHSIDRYIVSEMLTKVFSEMVFIHGFVHCDPHPGNIFVRLKSPEGPRRRWWQWLSRRQFPVWELVLLDHGLYRDISQEFRLAYAKLWKSVIEGDVKGISRYCKELGAGDAYRLFSSVLTHRTWSSVTVRSISTQSTLEEVQLIKDRAPGYLVQVAELLARLPRPLLLILKSNDLLRAIERVLHEPGDYRPVQSFFIITKYCADAIYLDGALRGNVSVFQKIVLKWEHFLTSFKVDIFHFIIKWKLFIFGKSDLF